MALAAFLAEEFFHQKVRKAGKLPSVPTDEEIARHNLDRFDFLRLLELLFLALLLTTAAANPATGHGQMCMILTGLQISRLFGRRILSRWSVLGVLQAIEMAFLATILLLPSAAVDAGSYIVSPASIFALMGGVFYGIFVSISAAFSISYAIRLLAAESSTFYETFPPLANSESWALRFSVYSLFAGTASVTSLFFVTGLSAPFILLSVSLMLQSAGTFLCRQDSSNGHHPLSHILWTASFLMAFILVVSGSSTMGTSL